jgi:hypothetical protein
VVVEWSVIFIALRVGPYDTVSFHGPGPHYVRLLRVMAFYTVFRMECSVQDPITNVRVANDVIFITSMV